MKHPSDGDLRRLGDDAAGLATSVRRHVDGCVACRRRIGAIAANARLAAAALSADAAIDVTAARNALALRLGAFAFERPSGVRALPAGAWFGAAAAALLLLVAFTPLRSVATGFLAIFEPQRFVALPVTRADLESLRALPDLQSYGTMRETLRSSHVAVATAAAAARLAGFAVREPRWMPSGVRPISSFVVLGRSAGSFTFSAARAAATARAGGSVLPPMPPGLDGSTLYASVGPVVIATYGVSFDARQPRHRLGLRGMPRDGFAVFQAPSPRIASTGASAQELEQYLLHLPGVPPRLAAQIGAIADPTTTLPIPIPIDRAYAQPLVVHGAPGLGIGDNTGLGACVVWQQSGMLYGVAGTLPAREIVAIANALP